MTPVGGPFAAAAATAVVLLAVGVVLGYEHQSDPRQSDPHVIDLPLEGTSAQQSFNTVRRWKHGLIVYNKGDYFIGRSLSEYGEWCEVEVSLFQQILGHWPTAVVVDVGANFGTFTSVFAKLAHKGKVIAFEPQRIVFQALTATIALNQFTNVHTIQAAAGAQQGYAELPIPDYADDGINISAVSLVETPTDMTRRKETVPVYTIDSLRLESLDFIKIDSEGMEVDVLLGARESIAKLRPFIYMETNHVVDSCDARGCHLEKTAIDSLRLARQWGYDCYWMRAPMYRPDNFYGNPVNVFEAANEIKLILNVICPPREKKVVVKKLAEVDYDALPYIQAFWAEEYIRQ